MLFVFFFLILFQHLWTCHVSHSDAVPIAICLIASYLPRPGTILLQSNPISLNCDRIGDFPHFSHNLVDCRKQDPLLRQDFDDCVRPVELHTTLDRGWETAPESGLKPDDGLGNQTRRWAVGLGLIEDCSRIAQFSADCWKIVPILAGVQKNTFGNSDSCSDGLCCDRIGTLFLQSHCNRDWSISGGLNIFTPFL